MSRDRNRYANIVRSRLPRLKRTIPLPGDLEDDHRYFRCWNCGFIADSDRDRVGIGDGVIALSTISLLLHMNGTNGSTTFTDSSPQSIHTVTANGNAQISTAQYKFGDSSGYFDGASYLTIPDNADFDLSDGYWTIDFWVRGSWSGSASEPVYFQRTDANNYFYIYITKSSGLYGITLSIYSSGAEVVSISAGAGSLSNSTWSYVEISESQNNYRIYIDGALWSVINDSSRPANYSDVIYIGGSTLTATRLSAYLDEFRVSKYAGHFDQSFTLPVIAYDTSTHISGAYYPEVIGGCPFCGTLNYR